jgi:hypothetical protein
VTFICGVNALFLTNSANLSPNNLKIASKVYIVIFIAVAGLNILSLVAHPVYKVYQIRKARKIKTDSHYTRRNAV